jgi:hypothetical protein
MENTMHILRHVGIYFLLLAAACLSQPRPAFSQSAPAASPSPQLRDDQHDFGFDFGTGKTHTSRLPHPLTGSTTWTEMDGVTVVQKAWDGRGNLAVLESDGPAGHLELLALRLYDPQAHQWSINFASSNVGVLNVSWGRPVIGEFKNGRGELYDQEPYEDRTILVRFTFLSLSPDSARSAQAFSADGGQTWETNWINTYTRGPGKNDEKDGSGKKH